MVCVVLRFAVEQLPSGDPWCVCGAVHFTTSIILTVLNDEQREIWVGLSLMLGQTGQVKKKKMEKRV